jgi:hypothetical protein
VAGTLALFRRLGVLVTFLPVFLGAVAVWLGVVAGSAAVAYRRLFDFDAFDFFAWRTVYQQLMTGVTIPFEFAAIGASAVLFSVVGMTAILLRLPSLVRYVGHLGMIAGSGEYLRGLEMRFRDGVDLASHHLGKVAKRIAAKPVSTTGGMGEQVPDGGRVTSPPARRRSQRPGLFRRLLQAVRPDDHRETPDEESALVIREVNSVIVPEAAEPVPSSDIPADLNAAEPVSDVSPSSDEVMASAKPEEDGDEPEVESQRDLDLVTLARAIALYEVWVVPPPEWMVSALREELEKVSADGWTLVGEYGAAGVGLMELAAKADVLPRDPVSRAAAEAMAQTMVPTDEDATAIQDDAGMEADGSGEPPAPIEPEKPEMTMCAAWLCELLDNYLLMEEMQKNREPEFDGRWSAVWRETREHLVLAMRSMTETDWISVDRFPDKAGRVRMLTDRLTEEFRAIRDIEEKEPAAVPPIIAPAPPPAKSAEIKPAERASPVFLEDLNPFVAPPIIVSAESKKQAGSPPLVPAIAPSLLPSDVGGQTHVPSRATDDDVVTRLQRMGFAIVPLSASAGGTAPGDFFTARRGDLSLLVHPFSLRGKHWHLDVGALGPWRTDDGHVVPSPCRTVWQRLTLMNSMTADHRDCRGGIVVVHDGYFTDEPRVAQFAEEARRRTRVSVAWLDGGLGALPSLSAIAGSLTSPAGSG